MWATMKSRLSKNLMIYFQSCLYFRDAVQNIPSDFPCIRTEKNRLNKNKENAVALWNVQTERYISDNVLSDI